MPPRRPGRRAAGTGAQIVVRPDYEETEDPQAGTIWSLASYPAPDPRFAPAPEDRTYIETTEPLFWKIDGALAFKPGYDHPLDQERYLCTAEELRRLREPQREDLRRFR